jgi:tryptophanase
MVIAEGRILPLITLQGLWMSPLRATIAEVGAEHSLVMMTVTNNSGGGQPFRWPICVRSGGVTSTACRSSWMLACFAENAWFIKFSLTGQADRTSRRSLTRCSRW